MANEEPTLYTFGRPTCFRVIPVEDTPETKMENDNLRRIARQLQGFSDAHRFDGFQRIVWSEKIVNGRTSVTIGGYPNITDGFVESLFADRTDILKFSTILPPVRIGNNMIYVSQMSLVELRLLVGKLQKALYNETQKSNFVKFLKVKRLDDPRFREATYYRTLIRWYHTLSPKKCGRVFQLGIDLKSRFSCKNS